MERLSDLRFIIGLFFALAGALLLVLAYTASGNKEFGHTLNLYAGLAMFVFGVFMLWMNERATLQIKTRREREASPLHQ